MKASARTKRTSKGDVIVLDDDLDSDSPVVKSAKRAAEPATSSEVAQLKQQVTNLQQKLRKSEENSQISYRCAREARVRAERAELQLVESQESAEELRNELAEVEVQLEKATTGEKPIQNNNRELVRENDALNAEVADLKRTISQHSVDTLRLQERVDFLTQQIESERGRASEDREKDRKRIDELTYQLGQYEQWAQQQYYHQQPQYPAAAAAASCSYVRTADWTDPPTHSETERVQPQSLMELQLPQYPPITAPVHPPAKVVRIYDNEHPTNILQLYRAGMLKSVGLESAVGQLKAKANECGEEKLQECIRAADYFELDCEVCEKPKIAKYNVLRHFFSDGHVSKVRAHGAAVSLPAYQYWLRLLQNPSAAHAAATTPASTAASAEEQVAAAAASAAPSRGAVGSIERVMKEENDMDLE